MFASGEGVLDVIAAIALGILTLAILVIVLAVSGKGRLIVLVGSTLLVCFGTMVFGVSWDSSWKDKWVPCVLCGVIPILVL
jgi:hypothetical protein